MTDRRTGWLRLLGSGLLLTLMACRPASAPAVSPSDDATPSLPVASATAATATPEPVACPDPPPVPAASTYVLAQPAVDGILQLFDDVPVVALGERHGWVAEHDVIASLVCDPRFAQEVDAVVVEFGNRRLQPILDQYVGGGPVSADELAAVWRESTQRSGVWEHPVYRRFFGLIRTVNAGRPAGEQVRILAGDPPIDYGTVTRFTDCSEQDPSCYEYWLQRRDTSFVDVVLQKVLARDERALLIAGSGHMLRTLDDVRPPSIPQLIEDAYPGSTFVIVPGDGFEGRDEAADERLRSWPAPGFAALEGTWLGALDACLLEDGHDPDDGECPEAGLSLSDIADGYLYLRG
jgi:hypothetical protein